MEDAPTGKAYGSRLNDGGVVVRRNDYIIEGYSVQAEFLEFEPVK
jgi:hypothetical protein